MKFSKSMLLFASVVALSGCGMFGQDTESSDTSTPSQSESVSSEVSASESSEGSSEVSGEESSPETPEEGSTDEESSESSEAPAQDDDPVATVLAAIQNDVAGDYVDYIPTDIPLAEGTLPTAYTSETDMGIQIDFYATSEEVPYGDERLANGEFDDAKLASITIDNYDSNEAAAEQISYQNYEEIGGEPVDLGNGITGYMDAGAGKTHTSWNEGRWDFSVQSRNDGNNEGQDLAVEVVQYLEENLLTAPEEYGTGRFSVSSPESNALTFQKDNKVITIDGSTDPYTLLAFATYIQ